MKKLTAAEAQVLTELEGAPDQTLRESTLKACAPYMGMTPNRLWSVMGRLNKLGLVEKRLRWQDSPPMHFKLTDVGLSALEAWRNDVPEMRVF